MAKPKGSRSGNPNPSPATRFKPGNPIRGGRQPLQRREGDNRHTVLDACHQIATMLQGTELKETELKKKTRLWVMLYRISIKDPKTFLGYYAGMPRQAVDMNVSEFPPENLDALREEFAGLAKQGGAKGEGNIPQTEGGGGER